MKTTPRPAHSISKSRSANHGEDGIFLLLVALAIITIFGVIALGVDGGRVFLSGLKQQRTADAAALSAAHRIGKLSNAEVRTVATEVAQDNFELNNVPYDQANLAGHFVVSQVVNNEIRVETRADIPTLIAGKVVPGQSEVDVRAAASAVRRNVAVVLVIDVTGSMGWNAKDENNDNILDSNGNPYSKMALTKIAAKNFVSQFSESDRIGVVTYSTSTNVISPIRAMEPESCQGGSNRSIQDIMNIIDSINNPDGATNIQLGLMNGLRDMENWLNRVGATTDPTIIANDPNCAPSDRRAEFEHTYIVVMTDGVANQNIADHNQGTPLLSGWGNYNYDFTPTSSLPSVCKNNQYGTRQQNFLRAQEAADFIRQHGHVVLTVAIGPLDTTVTPANPWGTQDSFNTGNIKPNVMRWLANDIVTAQDNSDPDFPGACGLPTYTDMENSGYLPGISLYSQSAGDIDGLFQKAAAYITLRLTS